MDLEWNQAVSAARMIRKPVMLNGEIIQIGAIKTDEKFNFIDKIKLGGKIMKIKDAVAIRINNICNERNISINKLASISCLTQSTVQHLVDGRSKNPKLLTIVRICDGLEIPLKEFFNDKIFNNIDRED